MIELGVDHLGRLDRHKELPPRPRSTRKQGGIGIGIQAVDIRGQVALLL
jgi:hypothetical protein